MIGYPSGQDGAILPARDYPPRPASHIINPLLTKFVRSRWLDIVLVLFLRVYGPRLRLGPLKHAKKELGQYPAILTSHAHLVNNPYILNIITIRIPLVSARLELKYCSLITSVQKNSRLRLRPPFVSDQFSKIPKFS